ncbi:thermonuclease family protein [Agrobacterium larrymoorei]|uniref:thermonuclease family protein n=1 Tax=Agrobacterium larrymoorei TaxID=160699 RepID=UPI0030C64199
MSIYRILFRLLFRRKRTPTRRKESLVIISAPEAVLPPKVDSQASVPAKMLQGKCWVVDGDTIVIDKTHIRLAGIDAPELDHPYGKQSKWSLVQLCKGQVITAHIRPEISYDRVVAECFLPDGRDLSAEMVRNGMALDWPKFSAGKYKHLETVDARRKLWRADARQKGRLPPTASGLN